MAALDEQMAADESRGREGRRLQITHGNLRVTNMHVDEPHLQVDADAAKKQTRKSRSAV